MTTIAIRQKLRNYLDVADDKKIKAIYTMVEDEIEDYENNRNILREELDNRYEEYKNGKAKLVSAEESQKRVREILKKVGKR